MKKYVILLIFLLTGFQNSYGTEADKKACVGAEYSMLDFWLGEWDLTWQGGTGHNSITKTYGGCVIQEEFTSSAFQGMSISMFDKTTSQWRQTWMDDQGSYFDFYAIIDGDNFIFQTIEDPANKNTKQRMIFTDVKENSLTWLWQKTTDGGKNWQEMWKIHYLRRQ